jgi:hypothetical protein
MKATSPTTAKANVTSAARLVRSFDKVELTSSAGVWYILECRRPRMAFRAANSSMMPTSEIFAANNQP